MPSERGVEQVRSFVLRRMARVELAVDHERRNRE
jgi:hypothetical protein